MATDTGRGTRKGASRTLTAADQNDGAEALDQAEPSKRRVHVPKGAWHQEIKASGESGPDKGTSEWKRAIESSEIPGIGLSLRMTLSQPAITLLEKVRLKRSIWRRRMISRRVAE